MKDLSTIISFLNLLGLVGVGWFLYYFIKGLYQRINSLSGLIEEQKQTLDCVRDRASEVDLLSQAYKQALNDFEEMGEKIEKRRKELILELEQENVKKDEKLSQYKRLELEELELKRLSLEKIPQLVLQRHFNL